MEEETRKNSNVEKNTFWHLFEIGYISYLVKIKIALRHKSETIRSLCNQIGRILIFLETPYSFNPATDIKMLKEEIDFMLLNVSSYYQDDVHFVTLGKELSLIHIFGVNSTEAQSIQSDFEFDLIKCDIKKKDFFLPVSYGKSTQEIMDYQMDFLEIWLSTFSYEKISAYKKKYTDSIVKNLKKEEGVVSKNYFTSSKELKEYFGMKKEESIPKNKLLFKDNQTHSSKCTIL